MEKSGGSRPVLSKTIIVMVLNDDQVKEVVLGE